MATKIPFGRIFTRKYTNMAFVPGYRNHATDKTIKMWKNVLIFGAVPALTICGVNCYLLTQEEKKHKRPEYIPYEYMHIRTKSFPWGDGNHTLFHNPRRNPIPGIGYEEDEE